MNTLRRKFIASVAVMLVLFGTLSAIGFVELSAWSRAVEYLVRETSRFYLDGRVEAAVARAAGESASYILSGNEDYREEAEEALERGREALEGLRRLAATDDVEYHPDEVVHSVLLGQQEQVFRQLEEDIRAAAALRASGETDTAVMLAALYAHEATSDPLWEAMADHHQHEQAEAEAGVRVVERRLKLLAAATIVTAGLYLLFLVVWMRRSMVLPLLGLVGLTERVAAGDLTRRVAVTSNDEIGRLQSSFNHMVGELETQREKLASRATELGHMVESLSEARDAAEVANRAKSEFLANISHEIRTPMTPLVATIELLRGTPLDGAQARYVELAGKAASNLQRLLTDVLDISRIEAGRMQLEIVGFDPAEQVRQVCELGARRAESKGLALRLTVADGLPRVLGDPLRLSQVLTNLLDNAVKFTEQGGVEVQVESRVLGHDRVRLLYSVRDTGIGIPADQLDHVFESFRQADGSNTRRYGGSGLGLAIASQLVQMMGGRMRVESRPGEGSRFHFDVVLRMQPDSLVPVEEVAPAAVAVEATTDGARPQVLLVEDNADTAEVVRALLASLDLDVTVAGHGLDAVRLAAEQRFDLVLMDCQLPGIDGVEAATRIRAGGASRRTTLVALTANATIEQRERCQRAGMDDFLAKPFAREQLRDLVRRWLPGAAAA